MRSFIVTLLVILLMWTGCTYVACHAPLSVGSPPPEQDPVVCGIDTLTEFRFDLLRDRRVGLITNHTGLDGAGRRTVDVMAESDVFELVALFSPEHGFGGRLDEEGIASGLDDATGLPIRSLYGATRRPTPQMLEGLDTLVFDIQDVGVRFYTYISTMGLAMEAAAEAGIQFVVLDRPNPLGGLRVAGPVLDEGLRSFVAFHELPVQHGMTVGELARMFRAERDLDLDLHVVELQGWERAETWTDTGLTWTPPSPNLPTFRSALLYPGLGLIETTNVSVGRGTPTPFELVGAPWMRAEGVRAAFRDSAAATLDDQIMIGVASFQPKRREFAGVPCHGVRVQPRWGQDIEPLRMAAHLIHALRETHPEEWDAGAMQRLLGDAATLEAVRAGASAESLLEMWRVECEAFDERRQPYLLYR